MVFNLVAESNNEEGEIPLCGRVQRAVVAIKAALQFPILECPGLGVIILAPISLVIVSIVNLPTPVISM